MIMMQSDPNQFSQGNIKLNQNFLHDETQNSSIEVSLDNFGINPNNYQLRLENY